MRNDEGEAYMAEELALEAEGSCLVCISQTSVFCEDDNEDCDFLGEAFWVL
jgi:hypothetical protein